MAKAELAFLGSTCNRYVPANLICYLYKVTYVIWSLTHNTDLLPTEFKILFTGLALINHTKKKKKKTLISQWLKTKGLSEKLLSNISLLLSYKATYCPRDG